MPDKEKPTVSLSDVVDELRRLNRSIRRMENRLARKPSVLRIGLGVVVGLVLWVILCFFGTWWLFGEIHKSALEDLQRRNEASSVEREQQADAEPSSG